MLQILFEDAQCKPEQKLLNEKEAWLLEISYTLSAMGEEYFVIWT